MLAKINTIIPANITHKVPIMSMASTIRINIVISSLNQHANTASTVDKHRIIFRSLRIIMIVDAISAAIQTKILTPPKMKICI